MEKTPLKYRILFGLIGLLFLSANGQSNSVVATAGKTDQQNNMLISWTLGETIITSEIKGKTIVSQGFQQPFTIDSVIIIPEIPIYVVYPNPTTSFIQLRAQKSSEFPLNLIITDINGKVLCKEIMTKILYKKDLHSFDSGLYILTLFNQKNETIKSYKIIKH